MRLVCNATTPQELREEIVSLLLHRAAQQKGAMTTCKTQQMRNMHEHATVILEDLAGEVKAMEIITAWPAGLRENA